jgi:sodium/bile acid cotransporter 7
LLDRDRHIGRNAVKKLPLDPFLAGICLVLLLAGLFPGLAKSGGILPAKGMATAAVMAIFFVQGLSLDPRNLLESASNWKYHLLTQGIIFIGYPILAFLLLAIYPWKFCGYIHAGIVLLSVLPTTISTALVFTTKAGGNRALALINLTIANFAGILVVPFVMFSLDKDGKMIEAEHAEVFLSLFKLLVLPFLAGQLFLPACKDWVKGNGKTIKIISQGCILFILLNSFSNAFSNRVFKDAAEMGMGKLIVFVSLLYICSRLLVWLGTRKLDPAIGKAVFFCGCQKTLAAGIPLATATFGQDHHAMGLILLPMLLYHPIQLSIDGIIAAKWEG